ncbi:MAG: RluA family pseudouridine synthase [Candidatus Omnitrophica bacterium]|nr:RluA family pseudouridine synthase [Candidatus Omnitrophota bacterium]
MQEYRLKVSSEDSGCRLDLYLFKYFEKLNLGFSRTYIQSLIQDEKVRLNGEVRLKPHCKLKHDDEITVYVEEKKEESLLAENIPLDIVYEDEDLAIINKPIGLVVHAAPGNYQHTLVNALLYHFKELSSVSALRPGIVHRLDKATSGLIVIAKNNQTHLSLAAQFAEHSIKRKYIAIVKGRMEFKENVIELPIGRDPIKRERMSISFGPESRYAKTYYRSLKRKEDFSLLELEPYTGRTHQLRVHLAHIGHPILGDKKYGRDKKFSRLALHAKYLGFIHPRTKKFIEFSSEIPEEFTNFLEST